MIKQKEIEQLWIIRVRIEFDASHWLNGTGTQCDKIHGHRWIVEVEVSSPVLNKHSMVMDFTLLKKWVKNITNKFDHNIVNLLIEQPTAENISIFIFKQLLKKLHSQRQLYKTPLKLEKVIIYETPNNCIMYTSKCNKEDNKNKFIAMKKKEWQDKEKSKKRVEKMTNSINSNKQEIERRSRRMLENNPMNDRKIVDKMMRSLQKTLKNRPNKEEKRLLSILREIDKEFVYVGNGQCIIDGKNPDFINYKKRKIIEYNNKFWHCDDNQWYKVKDDSKERIKFFRDRGYNCLIVWDNELKNKKELVKKIKNFLREK